jgi:hypothetical protein
MIMDGVVCAGLLRLRRIQPQAASFHLPFGALFSFLGVSICVVLLISSLTHDGVRQGLLIGLTGFIAATNWYWARRREALATQPGAASAVELGTAAPPPI